MKNISSLILGALFLFSGVSFAQDDEQTIETYDLKGPVESIKTDYYTKGKKKEPASLLMSLEYEFDKAGRLSEWTFELSFFYLEFTSKITRNENGQIIKEEQESGDETYVTATYTYDEAGKLIEKIKYYGDGEIESTSTYSYDESGNLVLIDLDSEESGSSMKYIYDYDSENRLIKYKEDRKYWEETTTYKYDDDDNIIEESFKTSYVEKGYDGNYFTYRTFDGDGNILTVVTKDSEGKVTGAERIEYDGSGNKTYHYYLNHKDKVTSYTVYSEYDDHGNWTESASYSGKKLTSMDSREIDYY